jgi:hypothetical protein
MRATPVPWPGSLAGAPSPKRNPRCGSTGGSGRCVRRSDTADTSPLHSRRTTTRQYLSKNAFHFTMPCGYGFPLTTLGRDQRWYLDLKPTAALVAKVNNKSSKLASRRNPSVHQRWFLRIREHVLRFHDLVNQTIGYRLLGIHEKVTISVPFNFFHRLACLRCHDLIN